MPTTEQTQKPGRPAKTILGVDDSEEMQTLLHAIVSSAGYAYSSAGGGDEALQKIGAHEPFNSILLDVEMPGMDGFTLCERIRAHPKGASVPIIFLTFHNTMADLEKCKKAGGNAFIVKPFTGKRLLQHLDHWSSMTVPAPPAP
ncbi:MAG TPA: response regulator [Stellaceae bacterium]|nr:response regulator [Stellaceae bacterium]